MLQVERRGVSGGERVPPVPLGWYVPVFSLFSLFSVASFLIEGVDLKTYLEEVVPQGFLFSGAQSRQRQIDCKAKLSQV